MLQHHRFTRCNANSTRLHTNTHMPKQTPESAPDQISKRMFTKSPCFIDVSCLVASLKLPSIDPTPDNWPYFSPNPLPLSFTTVNMPTCSSCDDQYKRLLSPKCGRCVYKETVTQALTVGHPPPPIQTQFCMDCSRGATKLTPGNLCVDCQCSDSEVSDHHKKKNVRRNSRTSLQKNKITARTKTPEAQSQKIKKIKKTYNPLLNSEWSFYFL